MKPRYRTNKPMGKNREKAALVIIASLFMLYALTNFIFLIKSRFIPCSDSLHYLGMTYMLAGEGVLPGAGRLLIDGPVTMAVAAIAVKLFGFSINVAIMTNLLYFTVIIISVYITARKIFDAGTGLLSVLLLSMFPGIFGYSRTFLLDFPLTAAVTLSVMMIIVSKDRKQIYYSVLAGLCLGIGVLTKITFPLYVVFVVMYLALEHGYGGRKLFVAVSVGTAVAMIWYLPHMGTVAKNLIYEINLHKTSGADHISLRFDYFFYLYKEMLLVPFFILFLWAFVRSIGRKEYFLPFIIVMPLLILSVISATHQRYALPLLPYIAIMMARSLLRSRYSGISTAGVCVLGIVQFFAVNYANKESYMRRLLPGTPGFMRGYYHITDEGNWKVKDALEVIDKDSAGAPVSVLVISPYQKILFAMRLEAFESGIPAELYNPAESGNEGADGTDFGRILYDHDYLIYRKGCPFEGFREYREYYRNANKALSDHASNLDLISSEELPDSTVRKIYRIRQMQGER
ncbi:MAG: glycosyltransferase family 39 protein [Elusimicrobia bacterium]|nr:glycosyltransferase family 39 protein [Elusimicrobiota bacterium]